jgi:hypothetical protein
MQEEMIILRGNFGGTITGGKGGMLNVQDNK